MLKVMEGKTVNLQVRIMDIIPLRSLVSFFDHRRDITELSELYKTVLDSLLQAHEVKMETRPLASHYTNSYPVGMQPGLALPPFHVPKFGRVSRELGQVNTQIADQIHTVEVSLPDTGVSRIFHMTSMRTIVSWVLEQSCHPHWGTSIKSVSISLCPVVDDAYCLLTYVVNHKIIYSVSGLHLTETDRSQLKEKTILVVQAIHGHFEQPGVKSEQWSQMADSHWGCYRVKMHSENNEPKIINICGVHSMYDALNIQAVIVGGLIAYGGQKIVQHGVLNDKGTSIPSCPL
jgi:hypothetical protein